MDSNRRLGGLLVRRECWTLSLPGKLLVLLLVVGAIVAGAWRAHSFLAVTEPVPTDYLIVEGWIPEYALDEAVDIFRMGNYRHLITCGGIANDGWNDTPKYTTADWTLARLKKRGIVDGVVAVQNYVERKDRTYNSALAVGAWLQKNTPGKVSVNVVTVGTHARRTRLLFQHALGNQAEVGIISIDDRNYDPAQWWASSEGARTVLGELIAYTYARCLFTPFGNNHPTSPDRRL